MIEDLLDEIVIEDVAGCMSSGKHTFVISPMKGPHVRKNVISGTYGDILASELRVDVYTASGRLYGNYSGTYRKT